MQSQKYTKKALLFLLFVFFFFQLHTPAQTSKESLYLKEQISKLQDDLDVQKELTTNLLERLDE